MHRLLALAALAAFTAIAAPAFAEAQQFRFNRDAQQSCPDDQVVWLNTDSGGYYRRGQNGYASTMTGPGAFVCRKDAEKNKHKPGRDFGEQDSGQRNYRMIEPTEGAAPAQ
jgi:hypothetical protein